MIQSKHVHIQKLTSGDPVPRVSVGLKRGELPHQLRQHIAALGPEPKTSLEAFADLGLSDDEIARYFKVPETCISKLCQIWQIR